MALEQQLLQVSAKLFKHLGETAHGEERDAYMQTLDEHLDERGRLIAMLGQENIKLSDANPQHALLKELDKGIGERLIAFMGVIKQDMKNVQATKKSEVQYHNPYASVQVMDGKYYDQKK